MVFIIDFGLAKKYTLNGAHIAYKDNKNLTGTARYPHLNIGMHRLIRIWGFNKVAEMMSRA